MRKLITAMKISLDGRFEGPQGYADWVSAWSDDYGLTPEIDACVLGGRMYPGYEQYWTPIQDHPDQVHPLSGVVPTPTSVPGPTSSRTTFPDAGASSSVSTLSVLTSAIGWPRRTTSRW